MSKTLRFYLIKFFLLYLRISCRLQLSKIAPKHIIGITGSAGKSSCREAVYAVLKNKYHVKQSSSGNSQTGLPLDILGFGGEYNYSYSFWLKVLLLTPLKLLFNWEKYDIYIAEMGIDSPDEPSNMTYLLKILRPDIAVFLNVLPVHTEYFGQDDGKTLVKRIAQEKGKLVTQLPKNGAAVLNADDPNVIVYQNRTPAKIITFGQSKKGDYKPFHLDIPGYALTDDYAATFAAASAVGSILGIGLSEAKDQLKKNFSLPAGRGTILTGINGSKIIDSSYNSSRIPAISSLRLLKRYPGNRKIAILGDMRELGSLAKQEHEAVAAEAVKDAGYIFTFGPLMKEYFLPKTRQLGFQNVQPLTSMPELISQTKSFLKPGDVVLVKGSQNTILLESLVEQILADPEDKDKLCRRGEFWEKKRHELLVVS